MSYKRLKSLALMFLIVAMVLTTAVPIWAAGEKWTGIADGDILIQDTITKISDGVYEHEVITNSEEGNDQKIDYLCEIEPSDTIKVVAGYGQDSADKWCLTSTTDQAKAYMKNHPGETVVAGINADFFNMGTGEPLGALVMEGKVYHDSNGRYYFGITKEGKAVIRNDADLSDIQSAVGGDALLINDGAIMTENTAYGELDYSRTAIGIKKDGTIVTFVTYGNRAPVSCGRTYLEIAQMLKNEGCVYALALDGGGSATLISRPEGTTGLQLRNNPVDGAEREVSSSLLIVSTKEATGEFSHAQLTPNNEIYTPDSKIQFKANGVDTAGIAMDIPEGTTWAVAEDSKNMGTIDADTGIFKANDKTGTVTVNLMKDGKPIGETSIEIVVPDSIYFATEEVSLGFEEESNLGIVVRSKGRDVNYKDGDIEWKLDDDAAGSFTGNIFKSHDSNSVTTKATATSIHNRDVSGSITVIVGKLPTVVWDFEDVTLEDGTKVSGKDYYVNGYTAGDGAAASGILSTSNYGRGGKQSIEVVSIDDEEPVRFGVNSLKLNYDFTQCGEVTEGACIGTSAGMQIPGVPTAIGVWVYAPEGVGIDTWEKPGDQAGLWLRGYVKDGTGSNVPYDFTLEPKVIEEGSGKLPGIYWEGWKYLEADLTKLQAPFSIQPGMTFRLMFVNGTKMGTRTANSIYFDNLQFVYGTNVDDIDNPTVDSITVNGKELVDNEVIDTNVVNIDSIVSDVKNKYTSGIDDETVRMYIDGVNVVDNNKYEYAYADSIAHLYNLNLKDGTHSVTVSARDGFGNEVSETRNFIIDTDNEIDETTVKVVSGGDVILGGTVELQVKASDATVKESLTSFKLGNQFKDYEVVYSDNYEGTTKYSKLNKTITVKATRKDEATAMDNNVIATLKVRVPSDLLEGDEFTYTVKSGEFETITGTHDTYSTGEIKMPVKAGYNVSVEPIIVGGSDGVIRVTNADDNVASNVAVYLVDGDKEIGRTDVDGKLVTNQFNEVSGEYKIYVKDDEGKLSFHYKLYSYDPQGDKTGVPHNIRFNTVEDSATQENITWMSNSLAEGKQVIQYAVKGSEDWTTVEAETSQEEFGNKGYNAANVSRVLLKNLTPGTTYNYKVGIEGAMSEVKSFTTDTAGRSDSKFFILGDIQDPDKANLTTVIDKLNDNEYDFGIQIGDAIDQANDYQDWAALGDIVGEKMLGDTDMISIMGNHEYYGDGDASIASAIYNNATTQAGTYYSVEYGNIYMAVINFCDNKSQVNAAAKWLEEDASKSDAIWKVLLTHQPAYFTNSTGGNDPVYSSIPNACEKAGIDVVFSGHDHSFARTNPLIDDQIDEDNGIVYYITGALGSKRYPMSTQKQFDYNTIFQYGPNVDYSASYLTAESNKKQMTIKMYLLGNDEPIDVYTIKSECMKKDHKYLYDPKTGDVTCQLCKERFEEYTGDAVDKEGNEYNLLAGKPQTGWVTVGDEFRYYDMNGVREKVTKEETPSTCIIDGYCIHTSESGAVYREEYNDAGGHEYEENGNEFVCKKCGHIRVDMEDCDVTLNYTECTYTGKARTPLTKAVAPDGTVLTKKGEYRDYYSKYTNNTEVGTASVTLTAAKYGVYVNVNDWRGNCKGSVTVHYDICPQGVEYAYAMLNGKTATVKWTPVDNIDKYVVYQSINGGKWEKLGTTTNTRYVAKNLDSKKTYAFRVGTIKSGKDENGNTKNYESIKYAKAGKLSPIVKTTYRAADGKPILKWNAIDGAEFTVSRATSLNGTYKTVFTTKGTTYTHISAIPGNTYYYKVTVKLGSDKGTSDVCKQTARCGKPIVSAGNRIDGKPRLTWDAVKYADKYEVYRSTSGKAGTFYKQYTTTYKSYTNTSAQTGKTYYYKVRTLTKNSAKGAFSDVVKLTALDVAPVVTVDNRESDGKPILQWNEVDGAVEYEIYRSATGKDDSFKKCFTTKETTYVHTSAVKGKTYYYKVRGVSSNGINGLFSDIVKGDIVQY